MTCRTTYEMPDDVGGGGVWSPGVYGVLIVDLLDVDH